MKYLLLPLLFAFTSHAASILVVGDSHMAGIFGKSLFSELKSSGNDVVLLGHSGSAPVHWLKINTATLSGGALNTGYVRGEDLINPDPRHWREKVAVPFFKNLLAEMRYHPQWQKGPSVGPDMVIIELGANDARAIADRDGNINVSGYQVRLFAMAAMVESVVQAGKKCVFVTPPDGAAKSPKRLDVLYEMIETAAGTKCEMYRDSRRFKASGKDANPHCDGYHFGCVPEDVEKAKTWSKEVSEFALSFI